MDYMQQARSALIEAQRLFRELSQKFDGMNIGTELPRDEALKDAENDAIKISMYFQVARAYVEANTVKQESKK